MQFTIRSRTKRLAALFPMIFVATGPLLQAMAADGDTNGKSPALCGPKDSPELGIQGDSAPMAGYNCGLTLLAFVPGGGAVQGAGHCAYVRPPGSTPYTGDVIRAYSLKDPMNPVLTDEVPAVGGSESIRTMVTEDRAILVSGRGVYDISDCEKLVKKGEIIWPSIQAKQDQYLNASSSHEIAISHDGRRVYSGAGFAIADISDLNKPETWTVRDWSCEMNVLSGFNMPDFPDDIPVSCEFIEEGIDFPRQFSHSSDDNLEGTRWYGGHQGANAPEVPTTRIVDISTPGEITIINSLSDFPGHSMSWWRTTDGREYIIGANELDIGNNSCAEYPRPTVVGYSLEAYIAEVTGDVMKHASMLTVAINRPEHCDAATASGVRAVISEHSVYNKHGAAFVMMEYGDAGLRVFDVRDGYAPKEVAYFNSGNGHVHSGLFHYDDTRGIMLAPGSNGLQVLELQPQVVAALGLPYPTDPAYPRSATSNDGSDNEPDPAPARRSSGGSASGLLLLLIIFYIVRQRRRKFL